VQPATTPDIHPRWPAQPEHDEFTALKMAIFQLFESARMMLYNDAYAYTSQVTERALST
jgi:hypothetical protein